MAINNEPTIQPRTVTGIFTNYIAKVLPLAFDESMSYYECLCALLKYINDTIVPDINNVNDGLAELQDFVTNYFNNLDVQEEINKKLDEMAEDGTLTDLIKGYVDPVIDAQNEEIASFKSSINTKVNEQDSDIAVLESRMDTFSNLTEGSTTGDAELADIRVAYNGLKYTNAGDAVRGQVSDIETTLTKAFTYNRDYTEYGESSAEVTVGNYYTHSNGNIVSNTSYKSISMPVTNKCYIYPDVNQTWQLVTIYNDSTFNSSSLVSRVSNPNQPTKENPLQVQAGNYVVVSVNNVNATVKIQLSEDYDVELNDIKINKSYNALAGIKTEADYYLNTSGGIVADETTNHCVTSDYFYTFKDDVLYFDQLLSSSAPQFWFRICYYDENKSFISAEDHQLSVTASGGYKDLIYKLTNSATNSVYGRICYRTYNDVNNRVSLNLMFNYENLNKRLTKIQDLDETIASYSKSYPFDYLYPLSVAHRGDEGTAPENTLPAFRLAKSKGWNIVETDIRYTSDGVAVLLHDQSINRTARNSDGTELSDTVNIADITYEDALDYDFGLYKGSTYEGVKICTVEELLQLAKKIGLYIMFDCGNGVVATLDKFEEIYELIKKYDMLDRVMFTAPSNGYIAKFLEYYPKFFMCSNIALSYDTLGTKIYANELKTLFNRVAFTCPKAKLTENTIKNCIAQDIEVGVYLYTSESEIINADQRLDIVVSSYYPYGKTLYDNNIGDPDTGLLD